MSGTEISKELNSISRIAAGMSILKGEVTSISDIRIDGVFEGKISCQNRIVVGENADLKADVVCQSLDIFGKFEGNAIVGDTLSLKSDSHAKGVFRTNKLVVEIGSHFDGETHMITEDDYRKLCSEDPFLKKELRIGGPGQPNPQPQQQQPNNPQQQRPNEK